jgi:hypothetical protein
MNTDLLSPVPSAQFLASAMLAVLFLQSGLDKVMDFGGNLAWLQGHFSKTPLRSQVKAMLLTITVGEVLAGALAAIGAVQLATSGGTDFVRYGAQASTACIVLLFAGQRIAKDYAGAATLVPYFGLAAGTILLTTL